MAKMFAHICSKPLHAINIACIVVMLHSPNQTLVTLQLLVSMYILWAKHHIARCPVDLEDNRDWNWSSKLLPLFISDINPCRQLTRETRIGQFDFNLMTTQRGNGWHNLVIAVTMQCWNTPTGKYMESGGMPVGNDKQCVSNWAKSFIWQYKTINEKCPTSQWAISSMTMSLIINAIISLCRLDLWILYAR